MAENREISRPILVVEDIEALREAITTVLKLEGYQVVTANNGREALEAMYEKEYCLILLDIQMPIMNGLEFLSVYDKQLRPHSPVALLTAEEDIDKASLPAFVIDFLAKPFALDKLFRVVEIYAQPV